jgi:hypothetical protein
MKSKKKYRPEYSQIVELWRKSGMSRQEFSRAHNYNQCTFDGWIKKVAIGMPAKLPTSRVLVPLHIDHSPIFEPQARFEVKYPNGVSMAMSSLPGNEDLSRIIHIYGSDLCSR